MTPARVIPAYRRANGTLVAIPRMLDGHLVNALLKALAAGEPEAVTRPLAAEVARRGLQPYAEAVAAERTGGRRADPE